MEDLDALLEELEQSSREAHGLQAPARLEVQSPRAQPPAEAVDTVYSPVPVPQPLFPSSPPTAAAQQLDKLLADLGHMQSKQFAAAGQGAQEPEETEPKPSLDNMLGSLTQDLQELGITATPTSVCTTCHKPIAGKVLTALGRTWHPEHFTCARCGQELGARPFFERDGQPYCEDDYHQAFAPCCAYCAGPIREVRLLQPPRPNARPPASPCLLLQKVLTALDQTWHPEHFFCATCGKVFGDDGTSQGTGWGTLPRPGFPGAGWEAILPPGLPGPVCPQVPGLRAPGDRRLPVSPERGLAPRVLRVHGLPERLQQRLLLRAGGSALLRAALPPAPGQHLPRLRPPCHRPLRHSRRAQVPPRALHLHLLPAPAAQGHCPRARQQDVLPGLPRQALPLSLGTQPPLLGVPGMVSAGTNVICFVPAISPSACVLLSQSAQPHLCQPGRPKHRFLSSPPPRCSWHCLCPAMRPRL
ncbi:leupaxin isoform X2 [Lathamus discolor]|uniref:leupaxin isoform X2 n=1 Tax=Lathamus discolor TaxID=678569 RepID=UPI0032B839DE